MEGSAAEEVAELLYTTYTASDTAVRRQAEEKLQTLTQNPTVCVSALLHILTVQLPPYTSDLKKSAAHFLKRTLMSACSKGTFTEAQRVQLTRDILTLMVAGSLPNGAVDSLTLCLDPLLDPSKHDPEGRVWTTIQHMLLTDLQSPSAFSALKALKGVFSRSSPLSHSSLFFSQITPVLLRLSTQILQTKSFPQAADWTSALHALILYFETTEHAYLKTILKDFMLADACVQMLLMRSEAVSKGGLILTEENSDGIAFNRIKLDILSVFRMLIAYLTDHKKEMNEENSTFAKLVSVVGVPIAPSPFINASMQIIPDVIYTLLQISTSNRVFSVLKSPETVKTVTEMLLFLQDCISEAPFYTYFSSTYKALVVGICMSFLRFSPEELRLVETDSDEFHLVSMDICEGQDRENIKTAAAQMMERLADNIDGALSFSVYFSGQLVEFTCTGSGDMQKYAALWEMTEVGCVLNCSEESRMEVGLLTLCVLAYAVKKREDLKGMVQTLLRDHFEMIMRTGSVVVAARLCQVVQFLFPICISAAGLLDMSLTYLLTCLSAPSTPPALHLSAISALSQIISDDSLESPLDPYIPSILSTLITLLPYQTNKDFFESLQKLIYVNVSHVLPRFHPFLAALIQKIQVEMQTYQAKRSDFIIAKCWNVVRTLLESSHLSREQLKTAEQLLSPLFQWISVPEQISFEDDIILTLTILIKRQSSASPLLLSLFSHFPAVQSKYKGELRFLFGLLNALIEYSWKELTGKEAMLVEMCEKAMFTGEEMQVAGVQAALLLQQLLTTCAPCVLDNVLPDILTFTQKRYNYGCFQAFHRISLLNTVNSALSYACERTVSLLGPTEVTNFLREILNYKEHFYHSYEKKLAVTGMIRLICSDPMIPEVEAALGLLLTSIVTIIKAKRPPEPPPKPGFSLFEELLLDSDEELAMETDYRHTEAAEIAMIMSSMMTPVHEWDEVGALRSGIGSLYGRNPGFAQIILGNLSTETRKDLGEVLQSKRIKVTGSGLDPSVLRKVVKAKRRL